MPAAGVGVVQRHAQHGAVVDAVLGGQPGAGVPPQRCCPPGPTGPGSVAGPDGVAPAELGGAAEVEPGEVQAVTMTSAAAPKASTAALPRAQKGATADINFRKALAYAFDYNALLQIENNAATLMDSPFPNAMAGHIAVAQSRLPPPQPRPGEAIPGQDQDAAGRDRAGIPPRGRPGGGAAYRPGAAGIVANP